MRTIQTLALLAGIISSACSDKPGQGLSAQPEGIEVKAMAKSSPELISPDRFEELAKLGNVQILDVRTPDEYSTGYLSGCIHADYMQSDRFEAVVATLDLESPILVYCAAGGRSARAAKQLCEQGFTKVYDMNGGIMTWQRQGKAIINDK